MKWIVALGILQGLDALITWTGVSTGMLTEANVLLKVNVTNPLIIPTKLEVGLWAGWVLRNSRALKIVCWCSLAIVVFNLLGLLWMVFNG